MIKLPKRYRGDGRHLYCNTCKKTVTSDWDKGENGKYLKEVRCPHQKNVIFYSKPYSRIHKKVVVCKSWAAIKSDEQFFEAHNDWHRKQKAQNYGMVKKVEKVKPSLLLDCINYYLDWLNNEPSVVPKHKRKERTQKHIGTVKKHLQTFVDSLRINGINPSVVHVNIPDEFVGYYHSSLESKIGSNKTFNHYIASVRQFYNVMIDEKIVEENPLRGVIRKHTFNDPKIIKMEELSKLLNVTTKENGWGWKSGQKRDWYRNWLKVSWLLGLFTGERRDGVFLLQWKHIEGDFFKIPDFKNNLLSRIEDYEGYHWVLITKDCAKFLATLKYSGQPEDYIIDTLGMNRNTAKEFCTASFTHFWGISSNEEKKDFKNLRKTQKTRELLLMGDRRKYLRGGTIDVEREHYIGQQEIQEQHKDSDMYPELEWEKLLN